MKNLLDLDTITLSTGCHDPNDGRMCFMEAVSADQGLPWSDSPNVVSYFLVEFGRRLNDTLNDESRQRLKPLIRLVPGTVGDGLDDVRRHMVVDWTVRVATPLWLDAAGKTEYAAELRAFHRITNWEELLVVRRRLNEVSDELWKARNDALSRIREAARAAVIPGADINDAVAVDAAFAATNSATGVALSPWRATNATVEMVDRRVHRAAKVVAGAIADVLASITVDVAASAGVGDAMAPAMTGVASDTASTVGNAVAYVVAKVDGESRSETYGRAYDAILPRVLADLQPVADQVIDSAIKLFFSLVDPAKGGE